MQCIGKTDIRRCEVSAWLIRDIRMIVIVCWWQTIEGWERIAKDSQGWERMGKDGRVTHTKMPAMPAMTFNILFPISYFL